MLNPDSDDADTVHDMSTLSWVHDELRKSLETAHRSLRRYLKEAEALDGSDVAAIDPAVLRAARSQVHQGVGALEMIGLPGPARVLRATENALQRFIHRPKLLDAAAADAVESASFGVLDYLGRKLAGKGLPTLALFPQYLKLQQLAGADRVHPADLWRDDWAWRTVPADAAAAPRAADASVRREMESLLLVLMRSPDREAMARQIGCSSPTSSPSARARACSRSCGWPSPARPRSPTAWRRTCCSSAPMRRPPTTGARRRGWRWCARPTTSTAPPASTTPRCASAVSTRR